MTGLAAGDRALFASTTGRSRACEVLWSDRRWANVRFEDAGGMLVPVASLTGIPRRPKPDF